LVEYTRLFIGPFGTLAPPYSSVYFGSNTIMSEETVWVINFYERAGLSFNQEKIKDAPDHVAVETEFLYHLIFNEIKEFEAGNIDKAQHLLNSQREFLVRHYKQWLPKFCMKILEHTNNDYYKALAECIGKFVSSVSIPEFPVITNQSKMNAKINN
jgi:TorA maturation chaperone TorD